jgi:hypothetical protein
MKKVRRCEDVTIWRCEYLEMWMFEERRSRVERGVRDDNAIEIEIGNERSEHMVQYYEKKNIRTYPQSPMESNFRRSGRELNRSAGGGLGKSKSSRAY